MPRPRKCRRVCQLPLFQAFAPLEEGPGGAEILLTVDEYETIRLIDGEGLSQEECSRRMAVARTTVQQIYACARKKLADMLVEGRPLAHLRRRLPVVHRQSPRGGLRRLLPGRVLQHHQSKRRSCYENRGHI